MTMRKISTFSKKLIAFSRKRSIVPVDRNAVVEMKWGLMSSAHMHMNIHKDLGANHNGFHAVCS